MPLIRQTELLNYPLSLKHKEAFHMQARTFGQLDPAIIHSLYKIIPSLASIADISLASANQHAEAIANYIHQPIHLFRILCDLPPTQTIAFVRYYQQTVSFTEMQRLFTLFREPPANLSAAEQEQVNNYVKEPYAVLVYALVVRNVRHLHGPVSQLLLHTLRQLQDSGADTTYKAFANRINVSLSGLSVLTTKKNWLETAYILPHMTRGYINLQNGDWEGCVLPRINIQNSLLDALYALDSDLRESHFIDCSLINANLDVSMLNNCVFTKSNLKQATLSRTRLISTSWHEAVLTDAKLDYANLSNAEGHKTDFTRTSLVSVTLFDAQFKEANFCHTKFINAKAIGAKIIDSDFYHTNFINANFNHADLSGCYFAYPALENSSFLNAKLTGAFFFYRRGEKASDKPSVTITTVLDHFNIELSHHGQADLFKQAIMNDLIRQARLAKQEETRRIILQIGIHHALFKCQKPNKNVLSVVSSIFTTTPDSLYVRTLKAELDTEIQRQIEGARPW